MADIRDVALRAGVSLATVSKVLNRPETVAEGTRKKVLAIIDELGYVRNASASQLRAGRSQLIGLLVPDVTNPFFTEMARGVEDRMEQAGSVVILGNSDDSVERQNRYLRAFEEQRVQGILIAPVQQDLAPLLRLRERGIGIVLLGQKDPQLCAVAVDNALGGLLAIQHLLTLGHRRIAFVHGPLSLEPSAERLSGARRAVRAAGLEPKVVLLDVPVAAQNIRTGEKCVAQILASAPRPTAIFCGNDLLAFGVIHGLTQAGMTIPQDMSVVGYDNIEMTPIGLPALTTVHQPKYELGKAAAELLLDEVQAPNHTHRQVMYQPELLIRDSTQDMVLAPTPVASKVTMP